MAIVARDTDYHERDLTDRTWAETTVMLFWIPEEGILGNAYVLSRPNLGAAISTVMISQGFCTQPWEIDFHDPQMHLPAPEVFSKFTLENGLSVEVEAPPSDYRYTYEHIDGNCSFDLRFRSLMQPFDVLDPNENKLLSSATFDSLGDQWTTGHYETLGRVTGQLELRGKQYTVDCVAPMDHSWGPRAEVGRRSLGWIQASFGERLGVHVIVAAEIEGDQVVYGDVRFGYVLDDGVVSSIISAEITSVRTEMIGISNHVRVTDDRGKTFEFFGAAIAGQPFYTFNPCSVAYQTLYRYTGEHGVGHGICADIYGLDYLAEHRSKHGRAN